MINNPKNWDLFSKWLIKIYFLKPRREKDTAGFLRSQTCQRTKFLTAFDKNM